jgi:glycogen(starch) synthase
MLRLSMRVLTVGNMYPPHHLGGYELVWKGAVDHMRAEGHEVTVLTTTTRIRDDAEGDPPHVHRQLDWYWRDHGFPPLSWRAARRIDRDAQRTLTAHLDEGPDVVLWWSMGGLPLSLLVAPGRRGVPSGAVVHDAWPVYGPAVDGWMARGARRRPAFGQVGRWSFNSAFVRDGVLRAHPDVAPSRCRVDHPGIDLGALPAAAPAQWRGRLACVGRIDERKGLDVAVRALALVPGASLEVTGGGDGDVVSDLRDLAREIGVADRITFSGQRDDVAAAYAQADAVLFPVTWDEPFWLVPLEAMAVGRPVVATGTGGSAEYLRDGENALVVPPGDAHALAVAVRRLADDGALRERLTRAGRVTAEAHSAAGFEDAIAHLARDLAGGSSAGA